MTVFSWGIFESGDADLSTESYEEDAIPRFDDVDDGPSDVTSQGDIFS
jgi:hypothetical protein